MKRIRDEGKMDIIKDNKSVNIIPINKNRIRVTGKKLYFFNF